MNDNCIFKDSYATIDHAYGIGVRALEDNLSIKSSSFIYNKIEIKVEDYEVGSLFANDSNVVITNCTFKNNAANYGILILSSRDAKDITIED